MKTKTFLLFLLLSLVAVDVTAQGIIERKKPKPATTQQNKTNQPKKTKKNNNSFVKEEEEGEEEVFLVVEEDPEFPGGQEALSHYLTENIKYPQLAKENSITGRVFVTFVVEKDGSMTNVRVLRDIGGGCGAEAVRVVKSMPKWKPGKQRGKAVRTQFNLPVSFNL